MDNLDKSVDNLLQGAPNTAPKIGFWRRRIAVRGGKRSAAMTPPDAEGHHPATRAVAAEVAQIEALIHTALVRAVEQLDRKIAPAEAQIRSLATEASKTPSPEPPDKQPSMTAAEQDALRSRMEHARKQAAGYRASLEKLNGLQQQVAELSQQREHLHSSAAGILDLWIAYFDKMAAHHREGFVRALTRRFPSPALTLAEPGNLIMPRYRPSHPWANGGQLPVTITEISPTHQPTLRWSHLPWDA